MRSVEHPDGKRVAAALRLIYDTIHAEGVAEAIESPNYQLRTIIKRRGRFPNDQAVINLVWLAIGNIVNKLARERDP